MNPDQPSREQIEARITALLLGELPAAEAELLRFTISRDPELQKLHDQLKVTIGFVREAMHPPAGVPVDRETPLKLAQERRQTLLAHFKTARPQPPLVPFWRRRYDIPYTSRWMEAMVVILIICGLAAMLLPVVNTAQMKPARAMKGNAGELSDEYATTTSGRETTKHMESGGATSQQNATINNARQITAAVNEWKLETGQASGPPNSTGSNLQDIEGNVANASPPVQIALPKTGSAENDTDRNAIFSQNVVGYVNVAIPSNNVQVMASDSTPPPPSVAMATPPPPPPAQELQQETPERAPVIDVQPGASSAKLEPAPNTLPTFVFGNGASWQEQPKVPPPAPPSAAPPQVAGIPPVPAGGTYNVAQLGALPNLKSSLSGVNSSGGGFGGGVGAGAVPITNGTFEWYLGQQVVPQSSGGGGGAGGEVQPGPFANRLQNNLIANAGDRPPWFNYPEDSSGNATNAVAMNQIKIVHFGSFDGSTNSPVVMTSPPDLNGLSSAATLSASSQAETTPASPIYLPPRLRQQYVQNEQKLSDSIEKTQMTEMPASTTASAESVPASAAPALAESPAVVMPPPPVNAVAPQVEQSPRMGLESQNANTVVTNSGGLLYVDNGPMNSVTGAHVRNGEINPATGLPEVASSGSVVPVVNGVPVAGELFPSSILRSPRSPQQDLKARYQAEEAQIQLDKSNVDQLRKEYGVSDLEPAATVPSATMNSAQVQELNEKILEQNALVTQSEKEVAEFRAIQATNLTELGDVLLTIKSDPTLSDSLRKLRENDQKLETAKTLDAANPDRESVEAANAALKQEIADRVNGIMFGLEGQVDADKAGLDALNQRLQDVEGQGQSYSIARQHLQDEQDLHKLLAEKIEADEADASMPKSALVTVINPATPGERQSLWQRMTGTTESTAQIEIQPDITSDMPAAYGAYDPYFLETELNSIKSDAVLGKVVDALKLDQAWSNQSDGEKLSRKDAIADLRARLDLESDKNTKLIDIGAKSDKPEEAANIANAVADAYKAYRLETHSNEMETGIEMLQRKYAEDEKELRELNLKVQQMEPPRTVKQANIPLTPPQATNAAIPQPEVLTSDNAFSTFSMNVSDVSFKLAMASLQKGQMPNPASIRSEEFINAFDYHDPEPLQGEPLAFMSERALDPFAHERDLLRFSIKAAAAGRQNGRALNLVLLLDTSGSMERADRAEIIREALRVLSEQLQPQDVVSVVTFARTARLWADGIPGNEAGATLDQVGSITPEGGTNLEEAMRLAYETALRHFIAGGMNRVVLLTDGAANLGNVDPQTLTQKVDSERRQGIALDCFGIGWDDYNDDLLEQLSSNGDGRYAFINSPDEAATEFAAKLAGALEVAAEDVKVQVEFNPNRVTAWRQIGYAKHQLTKQQFRDNTVAAGSIASREAGNALYVIETNPEGQGPIATVRVRYRVPGTQDVRERSWLVDYGGAAPELAQSSPAMRLAVTAAEISEWMADSPFAQDVTPDELLNYLSGVPQVYGTDERPKQLEWMIREVKSVSGK